MIAMIGPAKKHTIDQLRAHAISQSLFPPTTLKAAIHRLGFVQADPIRSPARAQDLILRHRVHGYHAGDLERQYPTLDIEEDILYAYGFVTRPIWQLLHPRNASQAPALARKVLVTVRKFGSVHPRQLDEHHGRDRVINAWGGYSKATKRALEMLHHRGLLRICRRDNGIRIYEPAVAIAQITTPDDRFKKLLMTVANILSPVPEKTLHSLTARFRRWIPQAPSSRATVSDLLRTGELEKQTIDGFNYLWPTSRKPHDAVPRRVRFLAPFDPIVWDRRRFEHLWAWPYRFEAYTPIAKRIRGYYAMPLLWADNIIGWANANVAHDKLTVDIGFVGNRPTEKLFQSELDQEIARLEEFLNLKNTLRPTPRANAIPRPRVVGSLTQSQA
jgi:uncharacterized protein YcaQ